MSRLEGRVGYVPGVNVDPYMFGKVAADFAGSDADIANSAHNFRNDVTDDIGIAVRNGSETLLVWSDGLNAAGNYVTAEGTVYTPVAGGDVVATHEPAVISGLVYNGSEQVGVDAGHGFVIAGDVATNAGNYTATLTLKPGFTWEDGLSGDRQVSWSIGRATLTVTGTGSSVSCGGVQIGFKGSGNAVNILDGGSLSCSSIRATATGNAFKQNVVRMSDGTLDVTGNVAFNSTAASSGYGLWATNSSIRIGGNFSGNAEGGFYDFQDVKLTVDGTATFFDAAKGGTTVRFGGSKGTVPAAFKTAIDVFPYVKGGGKCFNTFIIDDGFRFVHDKIDMIRSLCYTHDSTFRVTGGGLFDLCGLGHKVVGKGAALIARAVIPALGEAAPTPAVRLQVGQHLGGGTLKEADFHAVLGFVARDLTDGLHQFAAVRLRFGLDFPIVTIPRCQLSREAGLPILAVRLGVLNHEFRIVLVLVQLAASGQELFVAVELIEVEPSALDRALVILAVGSDINFHTLCSFLIVPPPSADVVVPTAGAKLCHLLIVKSPSSTNRATSPRRHPFGRYPQTSATAPG